MIRPRLDFVRIKAEAQALSAQLVQRGFPNGYEMVSKLVAMREAEIAARKQLEQAQAQRNQHELLTKIEMTSLKEDIARFKLQVQDLSDKVDALAMPLPNWTHPQTPIGPENNARVVRSNVAEAPPVDKSAKDHLAILDSTMLDFESATKTSGSRFVFLKGKAALCELGLINFALKRLLKKDFTPVSAPDLVKPWLLEACGFQPRGEATQTYHIANHDLCLTGTAEVPLAGLFAGQSIDKTTRLAGFGHCFRTEAGAAGAKQKGLYRMHQFTKLEMFVGTTAEESDAEFDVLVDLQVEICEALGLGYRVLNMPTEELGASAYRKFDVEVWMPGSNRWGEVASITNCQDFQARRLDCKFAGKGYAHTLNGTALAVPRVLLALTETHQQPNGKVLLPRALQDVVGFEYL